MEYDVEALLAENRKLKQHVESLKSESVDKSYEIAEYEGKIKELKDAMHSNEQQSSRGTPVGDGHAMSANMLEELEEEKSRIEAKFRRENEQIEAEYMDKVMRLEEQLQQRDQEYAQHDHIVNSLRQDCANQISEIQKKFEQRDFDVYVLWEDLKVLKEAYEEAFPNSVSKAILERQYRPHMASREVQASSTDLTGALIVTPTNTSSTQIAVHPIDMLDVIHSKEDTAAILDRITPALGKVPGATEHMAKVNRAITKAGAGSSSESSAMGRYCLRVPGFKELFDFAAFACQEVVDSREELKMKEKAWRASASEKEGASIAAMEERHQLEKRAMQQKFSEKSKSEKVEYEQLLKEFQQISTQNNNLAKDNAQLSADYDKIQEQYARVKRAYKIKYRDQKARASLPGTSSNVVTAPYTPDVTAHSANPQPHDVPPPTHVRHTYTGENGALGGVEHYKPRPPPEYSRRSSQSGQSDRVNISEHDRMRQEHKNGHGSGLSSKHNPELGRVREAAPVAESMQHEARGVEGHGQVAGRESQSRLVEGGREGSGGSSSNVPVSEEVETSEYGYATPAPGLVGVGLHDVMQQRMMDAYGGQKIGMEKRVTGNSDLSHQTESDVASAVSSLPGAPNGQHVQQKRRSVLQQPRGSTLRGVNSDTQTQVSSQQRRTVMSQGEIDQRYSEQLLSSERSISQNRREGSSRSMGIYRHENERAPDVIHAVHGTRELQIILDQLPNDVIVEKEAFLNKCDTSSTEGLVRAIEYLYKKIRQRSDLDNVKQQLRTFKKRVQKAGLDAGHAPGAAAISQKKMDQISDKLRAHVPEKPQTVQGGHQQIL